MNPRHRHWTLEEDELLILSPLPAAELAGQLGRTVAAVHLRRSFLGITAPTRQSKSCKLCGAPRYTQCDMRLCETHYLAYVSQKMRESRRRKRVNA